MMRHFRKEIKSFDRGERHSPMEFAQQIFKDFCEDLSWAEIIAAGWIYLEGGKALTFEDFRRAAEDLAEDEVVRDAIRHCPDRPQW
jgi:hypothetical protein